LFLSFLHRKKEAMSNGFGTAGFTSSTGSSEVYWIGRWVNGSPTALSVTDVPNVMKQMTPFASQATTIQLAEAFAAGANWCLPARTLGIFPPSLSKLYNPVGRFQDAGLPACTNVSLESKNLPIRPALVERPAFSGSTPTTNDFSVYINAGLVLYGIKPSPARSYPPTIAVKWSDPATKKYCLLDLDRDNSFAYAVVPWSFILSEDTLPFQYHRDINSNREGGLPLPDLSVDTGLPAAALAGLIISILFSICMCGMFIYYFARFTRNKLAGKGVYRNMIADKMDTMKNPSF
jgi:hypothetical protein